MSTLSPTNLQSKLALAVSRAGRISPKTKSTNLSSSRNQRTNQWDLFEDGITVSYLNNFLQCPTKHQLANVEGWQKNGVSEALLFGNVFHHALDIIYTHHKNGNICGEKCRQEALIEGFRLHTPAEMLPQDLQIVENVKAMITPVLFEYLKFWKEDFMESTKWMELEEVFSVPYSLDKNLKSFSRKRARDYPNEDRTKQVIRRRGKRDGVMEKKKSGLWMLETKTKGQIDDVKIQKTLSFNLQTMFYLDCVKYQYKQMPKGVIYNLVRRPQLRRGAKETLLQFNERISLDIQARKSFYFIRYEAAITEDDLRAWKKEFNAIMRNLIRLYDAPETHMYKNSRNCNLDGGCHFVGVCGEQDYKYFVKRETHFPELIQIGG